MNISINKGIRINEDNYTLDMSGEYLSRLRWLVEHGANHPGLSRDDKLFYDSVGVLIKAAFAFDKATPENPITAIQVVPVINPKQEDNQDIEVVAQFDGPTEETTAWGLYFRQRPGNAIWIADLGTEDSAMVVARKLAVQHNIPIEPQPWRTSGSVASEHAMVSEFAHPKIHSFPNGITVAELKPIVAAWPDIGRDGEPAEVWIETDPRGLSSPLRSIWPLNSQFKENSETIVAADMLFQVTANE